MAALRLAVIALMIGCISLQVVACTTLALSGAKRYKTEMNNVLLNAQRDFEKDGAVSATTKGKMEKLLTKYQTEFGEKGSYMRFKEMYDLIVEAEAKPNEAFQKYQVAMQKKSDAEGYLTTEIMD